MLVRVLVRVLLWIQQRKDRKHPTSVQCVDSKRVETTAQAPSALPKREKVQGTYGLEDGGHGQGRRRTVAGGASRGSDKSVDASEDV